MPAAGTLQQIELFGWVDRTALAVLVVFFVIGLFKGLIWQVSRIGILAAAYVVSGRFGAALGEFLARTPAVGGEAAAEPAETPETTLYLAYVLLFLGVLIVLSLLALLLQKLAQKAGLGFFDRLGGGVLGIATGACVVLFGLSVVHMFFRGSQLAEAAGSSHSLRLSRRAIDLLGDTVPDDLRVVFSLAPLHPTTPLPLSPTATAPEAPGAPEAPLPPVADPGERSGEERGAPPPPKPQQPAPPRPRR